MSHAYTGGNIGPISNNITKVWNSGQIGEEQMSVVKWLCFQNNAVIDYAKTLWLPTPPKQVEKTIKSYTKAKVPNFFIYAKDKEKSQVEPANDSTMNRIAKAIPDGKLTFTKSISKFDYRMLMNMEVDFSVNPENPVIKAYDYWNARINSFVEDKAVKNQDMYKYKKLREQVIEESGKDIDYVVNTLVSVLYTVRRTSAKKGLWDAFGDIIVRNLKKNLEGKGKICPICGKRFVPNKFNTDTQITCSSGCKKQYDINNRKEKMLWRF